MQRVNLIINNECYRTCVRDIGKLEQDRKFCKHGTAHCTDTARIMMLLNDEEELGIPKDIVYATALLHDIGRGVQYREGVPHETAGISIARDILGACGFEQTEMELILDAIGHHRDIEIRRQASLAGILYRADKLSRACYVCDAEEECDWAEDKKNMYIQY